MHVPVLLRTMLFVLAAATVLDPAAARAGETPAGEAAPAAPRAAIVPVETSNVCMMNDQLFDRPMIPVEVEGETYFGCCEMCKARLAADAALRTSKDPVTGREVDKATAIAGALPDGRVLYFESRDNLDRLSKRIAGGS
jgi:YHS domain-containing protein